MSGAGCATAIVIFGAGYSTFLYVLGQYADPAPLSDTAALILGAAFCLGLIGMTLVSQWRAGRRAETLRLYHLEVDDAEIRQLNNLGETIAVIDLTERFQFRDLHREAGDAIYRLYQGDIALEFHTSDPESERILTTLLGLPWPPEAYRIST